MFIRSGIFVLLAMVLVACNLGTRPDTPQSIVTPSVSAPSSQVPTVTIVSPNGGDRFPINQPVLVSAIANDSVGVTRVQLFANGSIVKTVSSASNAGDKTLSSILDYTPRTAGDIVLRILAYRGTVASDPVEITITAQEQSVTNPTPIPLPNTGNSGGSSGAGNVPVIPNDGVCRVLTNVGLNFRGTPSTTSGDNILSTLQAGTLAPMVSRLADNTWYKVNVNNRVGWVSGSAQFVTVTGNCFSIPVESQQTPTPTATTAPNVINTPTRIPTATNTPTPQRPDLIVTNIFGETAISLAGGTAIRTYSANITNVGQGSASQFSVIVTINNEPPLELGVVGGLEAGQSVVLTRDITFSSAGTYNIRVDIDPTNQVNETSEVNNRGDITVTVNN